MPSPEKASSQPIGVIRLVVVRRFKTNVQFTMLAPTPQIETPASASLMPAKGSSKDCESDSVKQFDSTVVARQNRSHREPPGTSYRARNA